MRKPPRRLGVNRVYTWGRNQECPFRLTSAPPFGSLGGKTLPSNAFGRRLRQPRTSPISNQLVRVIVRQMSAIDLYWLPLGAGGHSVRLNGKVFEWCAARLEHRDRYDLYHSALQVHVPEGRFVVEQAPAWGEGSRRGVVAEGAVGSRALGRFRLFRYEIRSWREGIIPDIAEAIKSPLGLSDDPEDAQRLLELAPRVPTPVWGRDELGTGEMWNSNSTISWLLASSGLDVESIALPAGGRAPGWRAGIIVAQRQDSHSPGATA